MKAVGRGVLIAGIALFACVARANNLVLTNLALAHVSGGTADVQFDVMWENSWRLSWTDNGGTVGVTNWDAVWVFAKYRFSGGPWKHLLLAETGHAVPAGFILSPATNDGLRLGALLHRHAEGSGPVTAAAVRLHWDYAGAGITTTNDLDLAVFGIEMVYIPEGSFYLGSGGSEIHAFYRYPNPLTPFLVTNAGPIMSGPETGKLYSAQHDLESSEAIPTGYSPFYLMKYEISQQQYADYLSLLDPSNATNLHVPAYYGTYGYTIHKTNDAYVADAPDRACAYLSWVDYIYYLDWCGLRPVSELEFEKACRGPREPYPNEYVWGTATAYPGLTGIVGVAGSGTETALPTNANVVIANGFPTPVRCGIFATAAGSREAAGAGYYGNLDLGGNVVENFVALRWEAREFADVYGDGNEYTAPPSAWVHSTGRGRVYRGGGWPSGLASVRASDRSGAGAYQEAGARYQDTGGRGVRSAPQE